jgi:hypothetical protein
MRTAFVGVKVKGIGFFFLGKGDRESEILRDAPMHVRETYF